MRFKLTKIIFAMALTIILFSSNVNASVDIMTSWDFENENAYNDIILQEISEVWDDTEHPLHPLFVKAIIATESEFEKDATNGHHCGLMQTPCDYDYSEIHAGDWHDPRTSIHVGLIYLKEKMDAMSSSSIWYNKATIGDVGVITPPSDKLELWNYVFASYNGGQATMGNAMAYAKQMGKDPHIWQNIVEPQREPEESPLYQAVSLNVGWDVPEKNNEIKEYIIGRRGMQHWLSLYYDMVMPIEGLPGYSFYPSDTEETPRTSETRSWYSMVYRGAYGIEPPLSWQNRGEGSGSHPGVDIRVASGTPVKSITDGEVIYSDDDSGWGGLVVIMHTNVPGAQNGDPIYSIYAHLRERFVVGGDVSKGEVIGLSGGGPGDPNHGFSDGAHLHFQIDRDKKADTLDDFDKHPYWPRSHPPYLDPSIDDVDTEGVVELYTYNPIRFIDSPSLDLVFLIDTTGSMVDDIENVKASANEIVEAIDSKGYDYRVAIADYRDYPFGSYGGPGDYPYNLDLGFSEDKDDIIDAINGLTIGWGADWQESVYSGLVAAMKDKCKDCINNADNYGWRQGVNKAIILMGDAPPHEYDPYHERDETFDGDTCKNIIPFTEETRGCNIDDVAYWSENIDPILVYSVVIGSDSTTYNAFTEISERTGGRVYTSPTASDIVDTIIEVIEDIGEPIESDLEVSLDIDPVINVANPGDAVTYSIGITNTGTIADTYDISIDLENFASGYIGYPTSIQESWTNLDRTSVEIEPDATETVSLTISVPNNWAGMEDVIYPFEVIAKSETDELISSTSAAELKIIADKRSKAEYSRLETIWLSELVQSSSIDDEIKNSLLDKLTNATLKLDQSLLNIEGGKYKQANNMLEASQNIINAFINQVEAQYDKKIMQPDAEMLMVEANTILQDIESAQNM